MKKIGAIILSAALAATMIAGCNTDPAKKEIDKNYGPQLWNYLNHQYYFDGEAIPVSESNFYFINTFSEMSGYASMGYYPATAMGNVDLSATFSSSEYATYGDYYVAYAEYSTESAFILSKRAQDEGITISDETNQAIDEMINSLRTKDAAEAGVSLDEYLASWYGPGMDEATFRKYLERYFLANVYSDEYVKNFEWEVPYIRYALFYAPESASQDDKDAALAAANNMKDSCKKIDDITPLAEAAFESGAVRDQGDISVPRGQMVPKFEEWAYGPDRKEGEMDIIYAPEYGYFLVGYLGLQDMDEATHSQYAQDALARSVYAEMEAKTHNFHTDSTYLPAVAAPTPTSVPGAGFGSGTMTTNEVLIVVFITLGSVLLLAVLVYFIFYTVDRKGGKNGKGKSGSKKSSGSNTKSNSSKNSKSGSSKKK